MPYDARTSALLGVGGTCNPSAPPSDLVNALYWETQVADYIFWRPYTIGTKTDQQYVAEEFGITSIPSSPPSSPQASTQSPARCLQLSVPQFLQVPGSYPADTPEEGNDAGDFDFGYASSGADVFNMDDAVNAYDDTDAIDLNHDDDDERVRDIGIRDSSSTRQHPLRQATAKAASAAQTNLVGYDRGFDQTLSVQSQIEDALASALRLRVMVPADDTPLRDKLDKLIAGYRGAIEDLSAFHGINVPGYRKRLWNRDDWVGRDDAEGDK
ncbi:hypothetical protein Q5752_007117 [Cryptotrichosporon argae]